eukprot:TRINITY_DN2162_c0_g2_i2.p1 TRINITY_DN2162_c0_g2~~TRINITY_DN2162_c0_g2_i2.p1  ORF type:complete len:278 (-),score=61.77 TRINITY_DN2162_c0_g2_i2:61-894(-)
MMKEFALQVEDWLKMKDDEAPPPPQPPASSPLDLFKDFFVLHCNTMTTTALVNACHQHQVSRAAFLGGAMLHISDLVFKENRCTIYRRMYFDASCRPALGLSETHPGLLAGQLEWPLDDEIQKKRELWEKVQWVHKQLHQRLAANEHFAPHLDLFNPAGPPTLNVTVTPDIFTKKLTAWQQKYAIVAALPIYLPAPPYSTSVMVWNACGTLHVIMVSDPNVIPHGQAFEMATMYARLLEREAAAAAAAAAVCVPSTTTTTSTTDTRQATVVDVECLS